MGSDLLGDAKYIALATYTRDGRPKPTPVWFVEDGGRVLIVTEETSWKVKRLRNRPDVQLAACDMRGRVAPGTVVHAGTARLLGQEETTDVAHSIDARYGVMATRVVPAIYAFKRLVTRSDKPARIGIEITPAIDR